jgi:hypothetical protein
LTSFPLRHRHDVGSTRAMVARGSQTSSATLPQ